MHLYLHTNFTGSCKYPYSLPRTPRRFISLLTDELVLFFFPHYIYFQKALIKKIRFWKCLISSPRRPIFRHEYWGVVCVCVCVHVCMCECACVCVRAWRVYVCVWCVCVCVCRVWWCVCVWCACMMCVHGQVSVVHACVWCVWSGVCSACMHVVCMVRCV